MADWRGYFKRSITSRISSLLLLAVLLILAGALYVLWSTNSILRQYELRTDEAEHKRAIISAIATHSGELIMRTRGYFVYLSDYEYKRLFEEKQTLEQALKDVRTVSLSRTETEMIEEIDAFFNQLFEDRLPQAVAYAQQNDFEALRAFIPAGPDNPVNTIMTYARTVERSVQTSLDEAHTRLVNRLSLQGVLFVVYILAVLLLSVFIARRVATDIGGPLGQLSRQASRIGKGEAVGQSELARRDEIGDLARAFERMVGDIQHKEEELVAQNEELQAQQDELQAQQEELQFAFAQMENSARFLEKRNALIQALGTASHVEHLLDVIISRTVELTGADKGMIVLEGDPRRYAGYGISAASANRFVGEMGDGPYGRIAQTGLSFLLERPCTPGEQGYHEAELTASELYIPILDAQDVLKGGIVLTRYGRSIDLQERAEMEGIAAQTALALDKLEMHEQTERQRQMIRDMLDTIHEGVQFMDLEGTTRQINGQMRDFFGVDADHEIELPLDRFLAHMRVRLREPEPVEAFICEALKNGGASAGRSLGYELETPEQRHMQLYTEPLFREGRQFGLLIVHRDITREYEVDRMKSEFVSTVSHELRTPLASVLGFAELLLHRELKPERQRKYISTIYQEANRLTGLINDFLDLQRMESGRQAYDMRAVSLSTILQETTELIRARSAAHQFVLDDQSESALVLADRERLRQVLTNLLDNAVKYSPAGGRIEIVSRAAGQWLSVQIRDEGLGIPQEELPRLFTKFHRVDNSDRREIGGTGLGLAIVKEILDRHRGEIGVESEQGRGSVFTFRLPLLAGDPPVQPAQRESSAALAERGAQKSVMLIENDRSLAALLVEELERGGLRVRQFADGEQALREMRRQLPDAVVLDLFLDTPFTGWDVFGAMREDARMQRIPVIISTAYEERERALEAGASEVLIKPYRPSELLRNLEQLLS
ncbi:response regulator [Paenibacillus sp. IB182496]|uniref:histidine kinase n=1 Tax=Paenibacillus sabuli TaxID=2772509 RepID=A0A927BYH4_9BACL|nr:ATP-binding protein [Paenibacillus sabuli]MBD2847749.1 response regulator [Paenibacillus sabuli]